MAPPIVFHPIALAKIQFFKGRTTVARANA
jgi:hypothetical protein